MESSPILSEYRQRTIQILIKKLKELVDGRKQTVDLSKIQAVAIQAESKIFSTSDNDLNRYFNSVKVRLQNMEAKAKDLENKEMTGGSTGVDPKMAAKLSSNALPSKNESASSFPANASQAHFQNASSIPTTQSQQPSQRPTPKALTPQETDSLKQKIAANLRGDWLAQMDNLIKVLLEKGTKKDEGLAQALTRVKKMFLEAIAGVPDNIFYISPNDFDKMFVSFQRALEHGENLLKSSETQPKPIENPSEAKEAPPSTPATTGIANLSRLKSVKVSARPVENPMEKAKMESITSQLKQMYGFSAKTRKSDPFLMLDEIESMFAASDASKKSPHFNPPDPTRFPQTFSRKGIDFVVESVYKRRKDEEWPDLFAHVDTMDDTNPTTNEPSGKMPIKDTGVTAMQIDYSKN